MAKPAKKRMTFVIEDREVADLCLQRMGELILDIQAKEKLANDEISASRDALVRNTERDRACVADYEAALEAWAEANKTELFTEPRSLELNWGKVGFRWTPWKIKFLNKLKVETIVEKLRANKMRHLIRVEESVDKEKALNYDNETLAPLGMKKVHSDEFYYELKKEEVK